MAILAKKHSFFFICEKVNRSDKRLSNLRAKKAINMKK